MSCNPKPAAPAAIMVQVAEAITKQLSQAELSQKIRPQRSYADWQLPLEEQNQLRVDVVPVSTEQRADLATRGSLKYSVPVDVAVRYLFEANQEDERTGRIELAAIDRLVLLTQEIYEQLLAIRLEGLETAVWQSTEIRVCPLLQHLKELRQFTSIVRITFRAEGVRKT